MPRTAAMPEIKGANAYAVAARNPAANLKQRYADDPEGLAERLGLKLPEKPVRKMIRLGVITPEEAQERFGAIEPGLRELVLETCNLEVRSGVAVGPRGGGKSQGVSFVEFFLWILKDFDALNLGGSELQAANVYNYLTQYVESHKEWQDLVKGEMKVSESTNKQNAWIRVLTASGRSVRSPHAGGWRIVKGKRVERGGLLVIDEEAEAEPEIIKAALPTINTARPSVNIRSSTFHNEAGTFAEVVDDHAEMGYKLYRWDVFDVCEGCDCVGDGCQSSEKCFREDHYDEVTDTETGVTERKLVHKAYCGGRAKYAEGWVPMEEIETLWKRMKRHHETFEIEQMGSRPGSSGFVIKDRKKWMENFTDVAPSSLFLPGFPVSICVDWGTVAAGVCVWQALPGSHHALLEARLIENAGLKQIESVIVMFYNKYLAGFQELACDIGGGGNYLNPYMRDKGFVVRDVAFATEKESAAAAWNMMSEAEELIIPEHDDFRKQVKGWRRKNGRIVKGDDHLCDASICYFAKFAEELGVSHLRVPPRTFRTMPEVNDMPLVPMGQRPTNGPTLLRPVGVSFGSSRSNRQR